MLWPVAGLALGAVVGILPLHLGIPLNLGFAVWFVSMAVALMLPVNPAGARIGILVTGLFLAVPCFVRSSPLDRCWLMCVMFMPFAFSTALVLSPPKPSVGLRLAYICTWCGSREVGSRPAGLDWKFLIQLIASTIIFTAAFAVVMAVPATWPSFLLRWFAGGVTILAFAEMATACLPLVAALFGVTVPLLMDSPWLSASIAEFWTKRWNVGASQKVFTPFFFNPLKRYGAWFALSVVFALSGLGHMLLVYIAIGQWGIGLVCASFFFVQPVLIAIERALKIRRWPRALARVWTLCALAVTCPLFVEPVLRLIESANAPGTNVMIPTAVSLSFLVFFSLVISLGSLPARKEQSETRS